jgi:hypothetical protein
MLMDMKKTMNGQDNFVGHLYQPAKLITRKECLLLYDIDTKRNLYGRSLDSL